jgi:1-acyl-sn-glycerol-3-phosphate acyltransferase
MLRASLVYAFVALYVLVLGPAGLAWSVLSGKTGCLFTLARACLRAAGWMSGIRLRVRGNDRLVPGAAYLFLSNHECNFDGPILECATGLDCRAVVKKEMMRIPLLSAILNRVNFVPVDRSDPTKARASIDRAAQLLREGVPFFAFPEGTRSRDGRLATFKKGVFVMAIKSGVPVVPVSIRNSRAIQPPGRYGITPSLVEVVFHEPIPTSGMALEDREALLQSTREAIERGLREAAQPVVRL